MMYKLTDTQLIVLSKAAASNDGAAILPERMAKAAAVKVGSSLVARKLMREIRAKPGMAIWREDEQGRGLALVIMRAGRDAIGVDEADKDDATGVEPRASAKGSKPSGQAADHSGSKAQADLSPGHDTNLPREGSKQALIITMLQKAKGASLEALIEATGWLPHTTRAALTGLRKRGFTIERTKDGTGSIYRILASGSASSTKAAA
jgi:hypothetical protein